MDKHECVHSPIEHLYEQGSKGTTSVSKWVYKELEIFKSIHIFLRYKLTY